MGTYKELDKEGKTSSYDSGSRSMPSGGSRYSEDTPSFESLHGGAGRGTQGMKNSSVGGAESSRPPMSKKWIEK